eukprot:TRINITY_DN3183_c0_g1_i2.p1 TRINITY_DN3183_c0_g1~~TRINITY_DN3183_c0_g1_i2.p1  ORF type:complete len:755 (+),score=178.56 TRINITY_DN3183_c0_g1_i2:41-2266(+)
MALAELFRDLAEMLAAEHKQLLAEKPRPFRRKVRACMREFLGLSGGGGKSCLKLIRPLNAQTPQSHNGMTYDPIDAKWVGGDNLVQDFPSFPALIKSMSVSSPSKVGSMQFDPVKKAWLGNDEALDCFKRGPALITPMRNNSSSLIACPTLPNPGNMRFDPEKKMWVGNNEDADIFPDIELPEEERKIIQQQSLTKEQFENFRNCERQHEADLRGWLSLDIISNYSTHANVIRTMGWEKIVRDIKRAVLQSDGDMVDHGSSSAYSSSGEDTKSKQNVVEDVTDDWNDLVVPDGALLGSQIQTSSNTAATINPTLPSSSTSNASASTSTTNSTSSAAAAPATSTNTVIVPAAAPAGTTAKVVTTKSGTQMKLLTLPPSSQQGTKEPSPRLSPRFDEIMLSPRQPTPRSTAQTADDVDGLVIEGDLVLSNVKKFDEPSRPDSLVQLDVQEAPAPAPVADGQHGEGLDLKAGALSLKKTIVAFPDEIDVEVEDDDLTDEWAGMTAPVVADGHEQEKHQYQEQEQDMFDLEATAHGNLLRRQLSDFVAAAGEEGDTDEGGIEFVEEGDEGDEEAEEESDALSVEEWSDVDVPDVLPSLPPTVTTHAHTGKPAPSVHVMTPSTAVVTPLQPQAAAKKLQLSVPSASSASPQSSDSEDLGLVLPSGKALQLAVNPSRSSSSGSAPALPPGVIRFQPPLKAAPQTHTPKRGVRSIYDEEDGLELPDDGSLMLTLGHSPSSPSAQVRRV